MPFMFVILPTDFLLFTLVFLGLIFFVWSHSREHLKRPWQRLANNKKAVISLTILGFFITIGLLDSLHFRMALPKVSHQKQTHYSGTVKSVLDLLLYPAGDNDEKTYSAPFATHLYTEETVVKSNGQTVRVFPPLNFGAKSTIADLWYALSIALLKTAVLGLIIFIVLNFSHFWLFFSRKTKRLKIGINFNTFFVTLMILLFIAFLCSETSKYFHIFGTDKIGQDVFYEAIKSVRTGLILGTLTTLVMLPFALMFGMMAGYFGGIVDDIIQYIYTTLSSVPGVLLIAASVLALQVFISNHPNFFNNIAARADARLFALCVILGITSWTGLCRLLRGETLKLREMDYVQAARALGVSDFRIILRHVLPNVMHIVVITMVLDFSGLVLAEAVLTYVGVGVDPTTFSWGNMINSARMELAREPSVWWPLIAAFILMFALVLTANLVADAVRDAFDPRAAQE